MPFDHLAADQQPDALNLGADVRRRELHDLPQHHLMDYRSL